MRRPIPYCESVDDETAKPDSATPTTELATLATSAGATEAAELLRSNGIECVVEGPVGLENSLAMTGALPTSVVGGVGGYHLFVAKGDESRAREALQGAFASEWFLRASDGGRYHSFEAATPDVLRRYVTACPDGDEFALRMVSYLADLLERERWPTVYAAFHKRHLLRWHERPVEGRTLDDWAQSCGCFHEHTPANG